MSQEAYRLLARSMRYVFILIAGLFFALTVIWMRRDQRRWKKDRKLLPDAGKVGEFVDIDSLRRIPVPREGTVGSGPRCDIRVVGRGVRRRHADVRFMEGKGLMIIPAAGRKVTVDGRTASSPVCAGRGSRVRIGTVTLTLKLFDTLDVPAGGVYDGEGEYDPLSAVTPGAESEWAEMTPLPVDRIEGGREDGDGGEEYDGFDALRPFDGNKAMGEETRFRGGFDEREPFDETEEADSDRYPGFDSGRPFDRGPVMPDRARERGKGKDDGP